MGAAAPATIPRCAAALAPQEQQCQSLLRVLSCPLVAWGPVALQRCASIPDHNSDTVSRAAASHRHPEQLSVRFWRPSVMAEDDTMNELFGSESEDDGPPKQAAGQPQVDTKDLFGSSDEEEAPAAHPTTQALGDDEDEPPEEPYRSRSPSPAAPRGPPITVATEPYDVPPQDQLRLVKLPNILGVEPRPFDPESFDAGAEVEIDARGLKRVRLRDLNCIRWRWGVDEEGNSVRESNARFVRWSDGSLQLLVGDEVLDVKEIDTTNEHTFMYVRLPNLIQGQGQLTRKLVFQPASLGSNLHKQMRAAAEKLHVRTQKVRATATVSDPKKAQAEREKAEAERIRSREKLAERQTKTMRKYSLPPMRRAPQQLNADYLEEDEELEEEGLAEDMQDAQRQRMLAGRGGRGRYDDEEAAARLAAAKSGAPAVGKRRRIEEEDEEEEVSAEEEEGDEEMKDFIVDEEEEEEGGSGEGGRDEAAPAQQRQQQQQQQQQQAKQRRQVVLSDSEED
ncbi:hypothetical protein ABPG75_006220 [Micractinium tetrahymenae]